MLKFFKEKIDNKKYLLVEISEDTPPVWHQVEMIAENPKLGLFEAFYTEKDEKSYFLYKVNDYVSLEDYIKNKYVDAYDFCEAVARLCWTIIDSQRYLLYKSGFLVNPACIFLKEDIKNLHLIYFPCKVKEDINENLKTTLAQLVTTSIQFQPGGEYPVATLLQYLKARDFNVQGLLSVCDAILREKSDPVFRAQEELEVEEDVDNDIEDEKETRENVKSNSFASFQLIMFVLAACVFVFPVHNLIRINGIDTRAALLVGLGVINLLYFALSKINNKKPREAKIEKVEDDLDKTVILKQRENVFGYLLDSQTKEKHELSKMKILIGRDRDKVDVYCENMAVGKQHALLEYSQGAYWIRDLESKNGTSLNSIRLGENSREEIKHGDVISLANCEYIVFLSNYMQYPK